MNFLDKYLRGWRNLVLVDPCPLCQRPVTQPTFHLLCHDCQRQLDRCQLPVSAPYSASPLRIWAWGSYEGTLKRAIATLKYDGQPQLARLLAERLAEVWCAAAVPTALTVVPIPLHDHKRQQRGFNQAELLAEAFCQMTRLHYAPTGLVRSRDTISQFQLSGAQRDHNLANAFSLGPRFLRRSPPNPVLLLDDIYTTGATARSAMQTLRRHGISVYGIAAVARVKPHSAAALR